MSELKRMDLNNMEEEQIKTYRGLLGIIVNCRDKIFYLYEKII